VPNRFEGSLAVLSTYLEAFTRGPDIMIVALVSIRAAFGRVKTYPLSRQLFGWFSVTSSHHTVWLGN
jgi:hypothetical protein